jgi:hypothetical protein
MVAYERRSVFPGFVVYDLATDASTTFTEGFLPQLTGGHRLT